MDDHTYIEERIREAHRMRDEAIGECFSAGWHALHRLVSHVSHVLVAQLRSHHLLPH